MHPAHFFFLDAEIIKDLDLFPTSNFPSSLIVSCTGKEHLRFMFARAQLRGLLGLR